jgi:hypothetical protein
VTIIAPHHSLRAIFTIPALLGSITLGGLGAALLGDAAAWRWAATIALGAPISVVALCVATAARRAAAAARNENAPNRQRSREVRG